MRFLVASHARFRRRQGEIGSRKKGPLGGAGLGKGGNLTSLSLLLLCFLLRCHYFPLLCWSFGSCVDNHALWSHTTLPLYVVVFTSYVKKNLAEKFILLMCSADDSHPRAPCKLKIEA